ncbi:MAG: hypothetical protein J6P40_02740 [Oscillospiraceae bacterium]|nr:hypothetical protein [Oscillospiraceae bacterium]
MNPRLIDEMSWRMAEVYGAVTDRILVNLARHFKRIAEGGKIPGSWDYQVRKLAEMGQVSKETEAIILASLGDADGVLQELLEASIREGLKGVDEPLREAASRGLINGQGFIQPELSPNQTRAFRAFYEQSANRLNLVNTLMLESTQQAYAATVADIANRMNTMQGIMNTAAGEVVSGVSSMNSAIRSAVQKMVETGITGFIDSGGHHWTPEAYVAMDVRTTMANTARAAVWEEAEQYEVVLYQVSWHDGARPLCYPWQGKVISRNGWSGTVTDDKGNEIQVHSEDEIESFKYGGGLFGVNCGHYPIPFIPGFSRIREPQQDEKTNEKEYQESQQQRALERRLREEKRDLAVLKAEGATPEEIKAQREKVTAARDNLDAFCDQTGRARRSSRESTPIKAEWPDGYKPNKTPTPNYMPDTSSMLQIAPAPVTPSVSAAATASTDTPKFTAEMVTETLPKSGIKAVDLTKWVSTPTEQQIIDSIGGSDKTKGSCTSLAYSYAGNKAGYDVHDFRGGHSCQFFSRTSNIDLIASFDGVEGKVVSNYDDFKGAHELLKQVEAGKEYIFGCANHTAVIRKSAENIEYLELQSASDNGWYQLTDSILRYRFGAQKSHTIYGTRYKQNSELIDISKLNESPDFIEVLRYINTAVGDQQKGAGGGIR